MEGGREGEGGRGGTVYLVAGGVPGLEDGVLPGEHVSQLPLSVAGGGLGDTDLQPHAGPLYGYLFLQPREHLRVAEYHQGSTRNHAGVHFGNAAW